MMPISLRHHHSLRRGVLMLLLLVGFILLVMLFIWTRTTIDQKKQDEDNNESPFLRVSLQPNNNNNNNKQHSSLLPSFTLCNNPLVHNLAENTRDILDAIEKRSRWGVGIEPVLKLNTVPNRYLTPHAKIDTLLGHTSHNEQTYAVRNWWSGWQHDAERFDMMGPIVARCNDLRIFGKGDEQKRLCFPQQQLEPGCVVFSIGGNDQWKFESEIAKITPCVIHTFDCTVKTAHPPTSIQDRVTFHRYCLGSKTFENARGERFADLAGLVQVAQVTRIDFLKMDIEGYEWDVLPAIIESSITQNAQTGHYIFPTQIALEIHYISQMDLEWRGRDKSAGELLAFFNYLFFRGGYVLVDRNDNPYCPHCSEIVLIKAICGGTSWHGV